MLQLHAGSGKDRLRNNPLEGKKVYIPPMAYGSGRAFAAGFRAFGVDADITPPSDHRTKELGAHYTSGDECYPAKVTIGDFMRVLQAPGADPSKIVLFMPTADGPCRFGQYAPFLQGILQSSGYQGAQILSPTSNNGYAGLGDHAQVFLRTEWRMLVAADLLQKMLLKYRPFEHQSGDTEAVYEACLDDLCQTAENTSYKPGVQIKALRESMIRSLGRFHTLAAQRDRTVPLIGVVGEIFCRLHTFSNENLVRRLEEYGGEGWISDLTEWVWYTNSEQFRKLRLKKRLFSLEGLGAWVRNKVQRRDEHILAEPFHDEFVGYEEPSTAEVLAAAQPYLPREGALGEMVLNVGKAICLARKGVDGIIDISPFTCMNGIVCEAIYPRVSRDLGGIPIRSFYFDGTQADLDRDLGVYMELAHSFQRRKTHPRVYPKYPLG
jgi:predicted nucleotide-binding protein (sugar kinase/HSP70/actin superfamily)